MKETLDPIPAEQTVDQEGFANRKLIRPSLNRNDHGHNHGPTTAQSRPNHARTTPNHAPSERREPANGLNAPALPPRKLRPSEQTNAENFYYQKQMQTKTPMVVVLRDGEEVHGYIEWYDKSCIKLNRTGAPNLMIYKPAIKYMFKERRERERKSGSAFRSGLSLYNSGSCQITVHAASRFSAILYTMRFRFSSRSASEPTNAQSRRD